MGPTLSSITWPTLSPASRTLRISSSSDRTLPPTRSAVLAVTETVPDTNVAPLYNSLSRGTKVCIRVREFTIGSRSESSSDRDVDSSASSDSREDREERISGSVVRVSGSGLCEEDGPADIGIAMRNCNQRNALCCSIRVEGVQETRRQALPRIHSIRPSFQSVRDLVLRPQRYAFKLGIIVQLANA